MSLRAVITALAGASALAACEDQDAARPGEVGGEEAVQVIAERVTYQRATRRVEVVGTARARQSAVIYPETSGQVTEILFEAGDRVEAGTALIQLESEEERLAVRLAQVEVDQARQLLERYRRIEDTGAVSAAQIDEARTALDAAGIDLESAQLALDKRRVTAPFAGYTGLTDIDPGTRINADTVITNLDDRSVLRIDFDVPEEVFGQVTRGDTIPVTAFSRPESPETATVRTVNSRIDPDRRVFTVRAEIANEDDRLRPGMSFRVRFETLGEALPAVPETAILWGGSGSYVWAIEDGQATRRPVTIVTREPGRVLVRADLAEGAPIVVEGVQKVREGTPVTDVASGADGAPGPDRPSSGSGSTAEAG
ncbi:efflux RND transporter periplasmic adaptor subunit [Maricaulaceae bacterium MS644]